MSQSSQLPTTSTDHSKPEPEPKSLNAESQIDKSDNQVQRIQKWDVGDWDADTFDSDEQNMSLAVIIKLAHQLSLLQHFLEIYKRFNVHLGSEHNYSTTVVP